MMTRMSKRLCLVLLMAGLGAASLNAALVGAEVALLVDVSGSVSNAEFNLQKSGYVAAFQDAGIQNAILSNPTGSVAVTLVYWSRQDQQSQAVDWRIINSVASAQAFAAAISATTPAPFQHDFDQRGPELRRTAVHRQYGFGNGGTDRQSPPDH